ncbi:MAG: DNA repair protein RadA [Actinobacteria bacterium]|nr:DNA repair protein RadA [Actinomycetota bacterium]
MARTATRYSCTACGETLPKWEGRCPACDAWGSVQEERATLSPRGREAVPPVPVVALADVDADEAERIPTGIGELDRVLGGGIVPGSLVLLGGEPGVGKSTLLTMALAAIAEHRSALLVTGEESAAQVRLRAERIGGAGRIRIVPETDLDAVCATIAHERPAVCVVDSVQTLWTADLGSAPGSVAQVREAAGGLLRVAKEHGVAVILVGHVTKDGAVAGPKVLEHLVDCVLLFEGDRGGELRVLRAAKNRFGATSELGVFTMTGRGLEAVEDPSALLGRDELGATGSVVACTLEGSRPLLLEVQALVSPSELPQPRRLANGIDRNRLAMLLAVLSRHAGLALGSADVFANVVGGVRVDDPAVDLAVALAVTSAARGTPTGPVVAIGEIGLTGRLRPVAQVERRLQEAARLGIGQAIVPPGAPAVPGIVARSAGSVGEALALALGADPTG